MLWKWVICYIEIQKIRDTFIETALSFFWYTEFRYFPKDSGMKSKQFPPRAQIYTTLSQM